MVESTRILGVFREEGATKARQAYKQGLCWKDGRGKVSKKDDYVKGFFDGVYLYFSTVLSSVDEWRTSADYDPVKTLGFLNRMRSALSETLNCPNGITEGELPCNVKQIIAEFEERISEVIEDVNRND